MSYPPGMRPLFAESAEAILGTYAALMDGQSPGEPFSGPFKAHLDDAEETFTLGALANDRDSMIAGWNELTDLAGRITGATVPLAVFLLASVVNLSELTAAEVMAQALARANEEA